MKKRIVVGMLAVCCVCSVLAGCNGKVDSKVDSGTVQKEDVKTDDAANEGAGESSSAADESVGDSKDAAKESDEKKLSINDYDYKDYVTLGEYKGLELQSVLSPVTDEDVEKKCQEVVDENATYSESDKTVVEELSWINASWTAKDGDTELIGYEEKDVELQVGAGEFFDGLEEALVGLPVGEEREISVDVEEDYYDSAVAGKTITFLVTVNRIDEKTAPEITDEWVATLGDYASVDDWKAAVRKELEEAAKESERTVLEGEAQQRVIADCEFKGLPEDLLAQRIAEYRANDEEYAEGMGITFDQYLVDYYGYAAEDEYTKDMTEYVTNNLKTELVLKAIQDAEGIKVDDADMKAFIEECLDFYDFSGEAELRSVISDKELEEACLNDKTWDVVFDSIKVVGEGFKE